MYLFIFFLGANVSLLVSVTGSDNATVTDVSLVELLGSEEIKGVVEPQEGTNFLVRIQKMPSAEFLVRVKGRDNGDGSGAPIVFQRQSSTNFRSSNLSISVSGHLKASVSQAGCNELTVSLVLLHPPSVFRPIQTAWWWQERRSLCPSL